MPAARRSTAARCRYRGREPGALAGALSLDEGTLATTASFDTARAITLGGGDGSINVAAGASLGVTSAISGSGALNKAARARWCCMRPTAISGHDDHCGHAATGRGGTTERILGNVANNGTLAFNRSNNHTFGGLISGSGGVTQLGSGITVPTATNTYTGSTTITGGTLQLGAGGATGSITGNVTNNGSLIFNRGNATLDGVISGTGSVTQQGVGATALSGANSYTGATTVSAGGLRERRPDRRHRRHRQQQRQAGRQGRDWRRRDADGQQHAVARRQRPRARHADDQGQSGAGQRHGAELLVRPGQCGRGPLNDLVQVADVSLGGKLNVALSPGGRLNVGIYRVINYGGALSNPAALTLGTLPTGADRADYFIQTSVDKQVNLAYTNGLKLNYWDGGAGPRNNHVDGGAGIWVAPGGVNDSWTDSAGTINAAWSQDAVAIFSGQGGTVLVDSTTMGRSTRKPCSSPSTAMSCRATGLRQADPDGHVPGGGGPDEAVIRVGAGSADGAGYTAAISAVLDGTVRLVKTDLGALACCRGQHHRRHGRQRRHAAGLAGREPGRRGARCRWLAALTATASFDTARAITLGAGGGGINAAAGSAWASPAPSAATTP